ncbi:hypothetical protein [Neobacillus niacini]|uniref:DUF3885 domain-containing protein n=1 Tax=Neobacillus niacini TaxID=86668 RepID=UPI002858509C|nr:hypothetical protein [Neobacillus niacini]MDR7002030.1 hypothetical protein [Neobacillus niacini]
MLIVPRRKKKAEARELSGIDSSSEEERFEISNPIIPYNAKENLKQTFQRSISLFKKVFDERDEILLVTDVLTTSNNHFLQRKLNCTPIVRHTLQLEVQFFMVKLIPRNKLLRIPNSEYTGAKKTFKLHRITFILKLFIGTVRLLSRRLKKKIF